MGSIPVQSYDLFMGAILILAGLYGVYRGMASQLASLASLVLSTLVAIHASGPLAPLISVEAPWNRCIAMLILFLITSLAVWMIFRLVSGFIDRVRLKEFDRQIGGLFGLVQGVLLCVVITFFVVTLSEPARQSVLNSRSGYYIALLIQHAAPVLPEEVRAVLGKYIEELDRRLNPNTAPEEIESTDRTLARVQVSDCRARAGRDGLEPYVYRHFKPIPTEHKKHYRTLGRA